MGVDLMGLREYARHRGVSLKAVQKAIATKRISVLSIDGKPKIDPFVADHQWEDKLRFHPEEFKDEIVRNKYLNARAEKEYYIAKTMEMRFKKECGKLVETTKVQEFIEKVHTRVRERITAIPEKLSIELSSFDTSLQLENRLREEIDLCISDLSSPDFIQ